MGANDVDSFEERTMTQPQPPECPKCGCSHAPVESMRKGLKDKVILKHRCRHCGKLFTRKIAEADLKLYGIPDVDLEGGV